MGVIGTVQIEVEESIDEINYVLDGTALDTGIVAGNALVQYTAKPGVRKARFVITEEGVAGVTVSTLVAGIM